MFSESKEGKCAWKVARKGLMLRNQAGASSHGTLWNSISVQRATLGDFRWGEV